MKREVRRKGGDERREEGKRSVKGSLTRCYDTGS